MREVVEQILENTYDYEKGTLDFSCTKLELELKQGESYEGSFVIYSPEGAYTKGYVSSTDLRMECLTQEFVGDEEEIHFCFHGDLLEEGEVTKGEFCVVSNRGEYYLPYVVTIMRHTNESSIGPIRNLFHFANLAKSSWQEAVKLFYSPDFERVLKSCDGQAQLCYQGLSRKEGNEQAVEEFLITMNKKKPIEYLVTEGNLMWEAPAEVAEEALMITRNGWGYTRLEVSCEGSFLFLEKSVITEDDFFGNHFSLPVYVDGTQLHAGKNYGAIVLRSAYHTVTVPVTVSKGKAGKNGKNNKYNRKKQILELVELYQEFRLKKINAATWTKKTIKIIDKMVAMDEKDAATRLFQAQMLLTCERNNEAGWILEHVGELMQNTPSAALEAYYLYLSSLLKKDEIYTADVEEKVLRIYKEHGRDWRVAWLLLFISEEFHRDVVAKWTFLEEQFVNGCRSPLIYVEAMQLLNMNPALLRKLDSFELQVLNYGTRKNIVSLEVIEQVIYLAERVKGYSEVLLLILKRLYEGKTDVRILKEICTLLIKGNKVGKQYFEWYEKGIAAEVRILNIYEYYMLSADLQEEPRISKQVLLYFRYQSNLDYVHSAYLYYYVVLNRKEYPDIYESYHSRIALFVKEQIQKHHINEHLAYLYERFLTEEMIDVPMAQALSYLLFMHEIRIEQSGMRSAIVYQQGNLQASIYQVANNKVYLPMYGRENYIVFEDIYGNRFAKSVTFSCEKLMDSSRYLNIVADLIQTNSAFDLYFSESRMTLEKVLESDIQRWQRLLAQETVDVEVKRELILKVLQYYYELEDRAYLQEYLQEIQGEILTGKENAEIVRYMVLCGMFEEAYEWFLTYGGREVDDKILLHLLEAILESREYAYESNLLDECHRLFTKGKFSKNTLKYLMDYYQGMLRELREIWKASKTYEMERRDFCERLLVQAMFSGNYVGELTEIFKEYVYAGPDVAVEQAYLRKKCHDFFLHDSIIANEILTEVGRLHSTECEVGEICMLAYLKYYAEAREEIQPADEGIIRDFIDALMQKGIHLQCMVELRRYSEHELFLADKTIVEYRANGGNAIRLHYLIMRENGEVGEYVTESMIPIVGNVCFKEFVLFFGESLQYYVTEEIGGVEKLTESGTCLKGDEFASLNGGKYSMLNDIVISRVMQDYNTFDSLMEEYFKKDFYNRKMFKLK